MIGPSLIRRRETLVLVILADGARTEVTCEHHLIDVAVRAEPYEYPVEEMAAALPVAFGFRVRPSKSR